MNRKITFLLLLISMTIGTKTFAQTEPTLDETVEWIRGKILAYGYMTRDVTFDKSNYTLTITTQNPNNSSDKGYEVVYLTNLNASSFAWEVFDKDVIRVTIPAVSSEIARNTGGNVVNANPNVMRFRFNTTTFGNEENLQDRFTKAMKTLIKLCGGYVGTEKF